MTDRLSELRALMERSRLRLNNAQFYYDMHPGDPKAVETLHKAQDECDRRYKAWMDEGRKVMQEVGYEM